MAAEEGHDVEMVAAAHEFVGAAAAAADLHSATNDGTEKQERIDWVAAVATSGCTHTTAEASVPTLRSRRCSSGSAVVAVAMDLPVMALVVSAALATVPWDMAVDVDADAVVDAAVAVDAEHTPVGS